VSPLNYFLLVLCPFFTPNPGDTTDKFMPAITRFYGKKKYHLKLEWIWNDEFLYVEWHCKQYASHNSRSRSNTIYWKILPKYTYLLMFGYKVTTKCESRLLKTGHTHFIEKYIIICLCLAIRKILHSKGAEIEMWPASTTQSTRGSGLWGASLAPPVGFGADSLPKTGFGQFAAW